MEKKIREWADSVKRAGCTIRSVTLLNEIRKKDGSLLFALADTDVCSPEGQPLPHIIFIRGHACVIIPRIENALTGDKRYIMVRQRRIGSGELSLEFPAGMLDEHSENPAGIAIKELEEETGLDLPHDLIFPLHDKMLYSSVGGSDEGIYYYGCNIKVDNNTFNAFNLRTAGNAHENEHITVELVTREAAESQATSSQVPLGLYLFDKYIKENGDVADTL